MFEECFRGVSKGDMYFDDIQLPRWADQFICREAAFHAQVVVDVYLDLTFVKYEYSLDPRGAVLVSCSCEDGGEAWVGCLGFRGLFLPRHGVRIAFRDDRHVL